MDFALSEDLQDIRRAVAELCAGFAGEDGRALGPDRYPDEVVATSTERR